MESLKLNSYSPEQTQLLGSYLGKLAQVGDIFLLTGDLGTGKTCLIQGIAHGLGIEEYAFSPSFVIIREYRGRLPLYHIDFYRLDRIEEITDLGLEEYFYQDGVVVMEWADRWPEILPEWKLKVGFVIIDNSFRKITLSGNHYRAVEILKALEVKLWR